MPPKDLNLKEKFQNYKKSLNDIKTDLMNKIKEIRKKSDTEKMAKILEDLNNK